MADSKLTALTAATTTTSDDLLYVVDDPSGTATSKKITVGNFKTSLAVADASHTHTLADVTDVTATATELNYTDGVTSAIQTQLDGKAATGHSHAIDDLSDVTITTPTTGQVIKYNGTAWVNDTDATAGGGGGGDFSSNTATSVDGEVVVFSGTLGKTGKRATGTGMAKLTSGVLGTGTAGTDYTTPSSTETFTNKTIDANGTGNSVTNLEVADFATGVVDTDLSAVSALDDTIPSAKAIKAALDAKQPLDSDLTTIAGLTATSDNFLQAKSSAWASRTPAQVTADLPAVVGDSGSGGTKGLVPAPAAGDAAANKFLKADGTWAAGASGMTNPMTTQGDVIYGGASGTPTRLAKGTAGQVLTMNAGATAPEWAAASGGGSSTARSAISFNFENPASTTSIQSYTCSVASGGTFALNGARLRLGLDGTSSARASIYRTTPGGNNPAGGMKNLAGHAIISLGIGAGDGNMYFRWFSDSNNHTLGTANQIGFKWIKSGGTVTLSATSGDGTTEQATTVTGVTLTGGNDHTYSFVQSASDVKFYVDGVLKATHSTNVPTSSSLKNFWCLAYTIDAATGNAYNLDIANGPGVTFDLL